MAEPTRDNLLAFESRYAGEAASPEGRMRDPISTGVTPQALQDFDRRYAETQADPEGRMFGRDVNDFTQQYDQEIGYADEFVRGVGQGVDMFQASMYAMTKTIGRELGIESLEGFGDSGVESNIKEMSRNPVSMARFSEIDSMDDFIRWSAGAFGQALPSLGAAMTGGGVGGILAKKAAEKSIYATIRSRMLQQMKQRGFAGDAAEAAVNRALGSKTNAQMLKRGFQEGDAQLLQRGFAKGSTIGAMIPSVGMQAGETEMTLSEAGIDGSLAAVFGAGFAGGSLEALPALRLINKMFPGVDKKLAGSFIKDFSKATGTQAVLEGTTEGLQQIIQLSSLAWHDPTFDWNDPDVAMQVLDAFAAGALVGAVTGGGAEAIGRATTPDDTDSFRNIAGSRSLRPNLPGGPAPESERVAEQPTPEVSYPDDFEPADNTIFEEIKGRAQTIVDEKVGPVLNKIGSEFNDAQDRVRGVFDANGMATPFQGDSKYRDAVQAGQDEFLAGHAPVLEDTVRYASEYAMYVADEAALITDPVMRKIFIDEQMKGLEEEVGGVATELGLRGEQIIGSLMGDIEGDPVMDERAQSFPDESDTSFTFGQKMAVKNAQGQTERYRTRGDSARPYKTFGDAGTNMVRMMEEYPSVPESAWSIREQDGGFVIAINDSGGLGKTILEDEVVTGAIEKARISARGNPDKSRHVTVKLPGRKANVILDVVTLVRDGNRLGEGDVQTNQQAFDTIMGHLMARDMVDDESFFKLREAFDKQYPGRAKNQTVKQHQRIEAARLAGDIEGESAEVKTTNIIGKDGKPRRVKQTVRTDETMTKDTTRTDPVLGYKGIPAGVGTNTTFIPGVKGSRQSTLVPKGRDAGSPRFERTGGLDPNERYAYADTEPGADAQGLLSQIEKESKGKIPTEKQQAEQSVIDTGGIDATRSKKGDRKRGGPLAKNMDRLKRVMATFPPPSKRTKAEQAEFSELSRALAILERKPKNSQENNQVNRALAIEGKPTPNKRSKKRKKKSSDEHVSELDKRSGRQSREQYLENKKVRDAIAEQDPESTKFTVLKPKPLKFKWVATEGQAAKPDGTRTEGAAARVKDRQAKVVQELTNKGLSVQLKGTAAKFQKQITWLVKKVQALIPNTRIVVMDAEALAEFKSSSNRDLADIANELLAYESAAMAYLEQMDTVIIRLYDFDANTGNGVAGLIHELGHAIHFVTWKNLGLDGQKELWEAFRADIKAGKRSTGETLNRDPANPTDQRMLEPNEANIFEFKEWMADQFVVWMNSRRQPRNALEEFFQKIEKKFKEFYDALKANPTRHGAALNETYADFADAVARRAATVGDPSTDRWFPHNKIGLGFEVLSDIAGNLGLHIKAMERDLAEARTNQDTQDQAKQKTNKAKIEIAQGKVIRSPYKGLTLEEWKKMLPRQLSYNEIIRSGKAMKQLMANLYEVALAPSTSVMNTLSKDGIKAADRLIDIFSRRQGERKAQNNYHQAVKRMKNGFWTRYQNITAGLDAESKNALRNELNGTPQAKPLSPQLAAKAREIRAMMNEVHTYLVKAGLPVGKIENYVPKMFNKAALLANEEAIINHYVEMHQRENQSPRREAEEFAKAKFSALTSQEAEQAAAEQELEVDELSMQSPGFQAMRHRYTSSEFMDQFLETDLDNILANYFNHAVKRAEYNRVLGSEAKKGLTGGDMNRRRDWNPQEKLDEIFDEAKAQGANDIQLMRMKNYVDANLGMYGRDEVGETTRKAMAGLVAYNNMRVLLFTVFASLPDMMGPVIRSGSAKTAFSEFSKNIGDIVKGSTDNELAEMAEALGIIIDDVSQSVLSEYVDNHYMPAGLRKWNDKFFKYTGLNWYTDTTRKYALAVGIKSFENAAKNSESARTDKERRKARKFLLEFNLTPAMVRNWVAAGKPIYNSGSYSTQKGRSAKRDDAIAAALVQFVDESIMSPNPAQRPIAASHPGLMLVYHLKGFMYAIYDIFLKRMKYNWDEAKNAPEMLGAVTPALGMLALTAVGIELRDLITGNDTKARKDGWEYSWTLFERSGLLGPAQLGWDFEGAGDFGQSELVALSGPALSHAGDLISKPLSQTIPKSIPVVSQLPWLRDMLRGDNGS
jgi:hypothetical protein